MEHCKRGVSGTAAKQILQSQLLTITKVQTSPTYLCRSIATIEQLKTLDTLARGSIGDRDGVLLDSSFSFYNDLGTCWRISFPFER